MEKDRPSRDLVEGINIVYDSQPEKPKKQGLETDATLSPRLLKKFNETLNPLAGKFKESLNLFL